MKIALLSGAVKNAGDYLIVERTQKLLEYLLPSCEIIIFNRNVSLEDHVEAICTCDYVVFAGGPGYLPDMYPDRFPLVDHLDKLKPRFFALGMGGYGDWGEVSNPIAFTPESKILMDRIDADGFGFGCRDALTQKILKASGYSNVLMTGCPAWYDLDCLDNMKVSNPCNIREIRHVAISDPASELSCKTAKRLVEAVRRFIKPEEITFVYHRGRATNPDKFPMLAELQTWLRSNRVRIIGIPFSAEGFKIYDDCDLHIGFRVHAHIYSLSHRHASFLIEEDARGFGVNDVFSFPHCPSFAKMNLRKGGFWNRLIKSKNYPIEFDEFFDFVLKEIGNGYPGAVRSFEVMQASFETMKKHIIKLEERLYY